MELETLSNCLLCSSSDIAPLDTEFDFAQCRKCQFIFDNPRPTIESIVAHYSANDKYDLWLSQPAARSRLWKRRLKYTLRYSRPGNLLDVGAGIGLFPAVARDHFSEVLGTEVSASGVQIAKERFNLDLFHGQLEHLNFPETSFDNVTLFHVLEHVPYPMETLRTCHRLLRPGGMLMVAVPNDVRSWTARARALAKRMGIQRYSNVSPKLGLPKASTCSEIHLSHFTTPSLTRALQSAGFTVKEAGLDSHYAASGVALAVHTAHFHLHRALRSVGIDAYQCIYAASYKA